MARYKLIIAYDGTSYSGWQIQPNGISIQETIQHALSLVLSGEKAVLIGSGRTDAGVHALGQTAHFQTEKMLDLGRLVFSLNGILPPAIRIKRAACVPDHFHSQHDALSKEYHYFLHLARTMDPFKRLYAWHVRKKLDLSLLSLAAEGFIGTHDFTSFANESHTGAAAKDPVRTLYRLTPVEIEEGVRLEFEGNGFLYKMVRNIVGFLVESAAGLRPLQDTARVLTARDRRAAGPAAPAHGLFLIRVNYPERI